MDMRRAILFVVLPLLEMYRKKFEPNAVGLIWEGGDTLSPLNDRLSEAVASPILRDSINIPNSGTEEYDPTPETDA